MKKIMIVLIMFFCIVGVVSCSDSSDGNILNQPVDITGTKWQYIGYFDIEKKEFIEELTNIELYFDTDNSAIVKAFNIWHYKIIGNKIELLFCTWLQEDSSVFIDALKSIESFKVENDKLITYYDSYKKYLLWRRWEENEI